MNNGRKRKRAAITDRAKMESNDSPAFAVLRDQRGVTLYLELRTSAGLSGGLSRAQRLAGQYAGVPPLVQQDLAVDDHALDP